VANGFGDFSSQVFADDTANVVGFENFMGKFVHNRFVKLDSQIISGKAGGLFLLRPLKVKKNWHRPNLTIPSIPRLIREYLMRGLPVQA
jgi:hypothetical protein